MSTTVAVQWGRPVSEVGSPEATSDTVKIRRFQVFTETSSNLLSVSEFAVLAGISRQAVLKMIAEKRVHADKVGEQHVISRNELDRYLSER